MFCLVLLLDTGCNFVSFVVFPFLPSFTGFHLVLPSFFRFYCVFPGFT